MRKPATVLLGVALASFVALALVACGGGAKSDAVRTLVPTLPIATVSAGVAPSATTSPTPALPTDLALQFHELREVDDSEFPPSLSLTVGWVGFHHGGPGFFGFDRYSRLSTGSVETLDLLPHVYAAASGSLLSVVEGPDGTLFGAVCSGRDCGDEGPPGPNVSTTFVRSNDGGLTWVKLSSSSGRWAVPAVIDGQALASNFDGAVPVYSLEPSGIAFTPPVPDTGPVMLGSGPVWQDNKAHAFLNADGTPAAIPPLTLPAGWWADLPVTSPVGLAAVVYPPPPADPTKPVAVPAVLAIFGPSGGAPTTLFTFEKQAVQPVIWLDADHILVIAEFNRVCKASNVATPLPGAGPAIVDIAKGTLSFIGAPFIVDGCGKGGPIVVSVLTGAQLVRVNTPGDCLNIRHTPDPSATVTACLADGALLQVLGKDPVVEGWSPVTGPNGVAGWAADAFLQK